MNILVLGANGMIGSAMLRVMKETLDWQVHGTVRTKEAGSLLPSELRTCLKVGVTAEQEDSVVAALTEFRPDVVINCTGLTKHKAEADDPLAVLPLNAIFPHRLARLCRLASARLVQISTDCVFSGRTGGYHESSITDAEDLYGRSKALGEVVSPGAITLRTSTIGHEFGTTYGLLEWFLAQEGQCKGFTRAIFSGLPTDMLAMVVRDHVIPRPALHGLYHVAAAPIAKYDLLQLIAVAYNKRIEIVPEDTFTIDRSLDGQRFAAETGFVAPDWPELVRMMRASH